MLVRKDVVSIYGIDCQTDLLYFVIKDLNISSKENKSTLFTWNTRLCYIVLDPCIAVLKRSNKSYFVASLGKLHFSFLSEAKSRSIFTWRKHLVFRCYCSFDSRKFGLLNICALVSQK